MVVIRIIFGVLIVSFFVYESVSLIKALNKKRKNKNIKKEDNQKN